MTKHLSPPSVRLKYLAHVEMGQSPSSEDYVYAAGMALPFLQGTADFTALHPVPRVYCANPPKVASCDDILFSVRAPVGELNLADQDYGIGRGLCAIRAENKLIRFYAWWALHHARQDLSTQATGSTYEAVAAEDVGNLYVPCPSLAEQSVVADYLDRETARIDALVAAKERWLELLAEKRRALITQAVTRGLNPDAPMRDSGVAWLGEVPAHWSMKKINHISRVGNGSTPARDNPDYWIGGTYLWLNSSTVNKAVVTGGGEGVTELALRECHLPKVPPGSILVATTGQGKTRGMAALLTFEATINQHVAFIAPQMSVFSSEYLRLLLTAAYEFLRSDSDGTGSTKGAITCEQLEQMRIVLPPLGEQRAIVAHIEAETQKLDALQKVTKRTVALLKERRAALIAAAVTGRLGTHPAASGDPPEAGG